MVYVLKDPKGKTVGRYKIFKNILKKGYELYDEYKADQCYYYTIHTPYIPYEIGRI